MIRLGVIFSLVFESLMLLCCGQMAPMAQAASPEMSCCATEPGADQGCCCCCEEPKARLEPRSCVTGARSDSSCNSRCECPLTLTQPRAPGGTDRRPKTEATASAVAVPVVAKTEFPRSPAVLVARDTRDHPPPLGGRQACERFCLWTI